jgi:hypothetical protein
MGLDKSKHIALLHIILDLSRHLFSKGNWICFRPKVKYWGGTYYVGLITNS